MEISSLFSTTGITDSERMLHTPGEFARKNLLYVQEVGKLKSLQPHKSQREKLDSFLLLGIMSGAGTITIGEEAYRVKRGDCALINCMDYYVHESSADNPWELVWVHFNGNAAEAFYQLFMEQNGQKNIFYPEKIKVLQDSIMEMLSLQSEKDLKSELICGDILLRLMNICIFSAMGRERLDQEKHKKMCNAIREDVNKNYPQEDLLRKFADKYGMDEDDLDMCFQKTCGITLRDYIVNRRFTAAKEMLRFSIMPVKEIIKASGIRNEDLFRKLFKDGEGMGAEEYRMKWSQWIK